MELVILTLTIYKTHFVAHSFAFSVKFRPENVGFSVKVSAAVVTDVGNLHKDIILSQISSAL